MAAPSRPDAPDGTVGDRELFGRRPAAHLATPFVAEEWIRAGQSAIYLVVAALLVVAAGFTVVGTVIDVVEGSESRPIADTGIFVLDRVLLLFIIAELLYTVRLVDVGGRIVVEPFLFVGLIAIVRRVLVIAADVEQGQREMIDFLIEVGALALLALVLVVAIHLLRRSARRGPDLKEQ